MVLKSACLCLAFMAVAISLSAEKQVKEEPAAPLVAADFECWEQGAVLVTGGWTTKEDRSGFTWVFTVSEVLEVEAPEKKMRGRFRMVGDLDIGEYQRLQRMEDAAFLTAFGKVHEESKALEYEYWNEARDGAVYYRDNDAEDDGFHKPDIVIPKDLTRGTIFRSFGEEMKVMGYEKEMAGPKGECEAVRIDFLYGGEEIDGEEFFFYRSENWYGRDLSYIVQRVFELEEKDDEKGRLVEESRLQRVIRQEALAPQE